MMITKDIYYIGVNDHKLDMFEGQYKIPNGMAYNSYVILDEKIAVMDSVDGGFTDEWLENVENILGDRKPDYIIVHHMEPDHSASLMEFIKVYPDVKIVASSWAFTIAKNFFGTDFADRRIVVCDGDTLSLGKHTLTFILAPMVHWPEVMMSYDDIDKVLFSADAFGKFGALDVEEEWTSEARRYYFGIIGKYGVQVQNVLKKLEAFDIQTICSLHGPVLKENISHYLNLYQIWSSFKAEEDGVLIAYTSIYGNTKKAVMELVQKLYEKGCTNIVVQDLARCDMSKAVEYAFRYNKIVLATTTYNGDIFPFMKSFIDHLNERKFGHRKVAFIENGSWAPVAGKIMKRMFEKAVNLEFADNMVSIRSALNNENHAQIEALSKELSK